MKFRDWWEAKFLKLEFYTAVVLSIVLIIWLQVIDGGSLLAQTLYGIREALYGALVALFGSLLGFIITAVSIVLGYANSERLEIVRQGKHYNELWEVFKSAIRVLALATFFALLGLMFDKDSKPMNFIFYLNVFSSLLAIFRIGRCIWVIENIIKIVTKPAIKG